MDQNLARLVEHLAKLNELAEKKGMPILADRLAQIGIKIMNPPALVPAELKGNMSLAPGSINFVDYPEATIQWLYPKFELVVFDVLKEIEKALV
ncbi:MAG: hypothetical protein ACLQVJ_19235 [Syntrophobacteraceae bacterium]